jgi:hypothetical protein
LPGVPTQLVVPFELEQELPQALQCVTLPRVVSQPLLARESQLPKPAVHAPKVQTPLGHDSAAFAKAQGVPHPPQLVSVSMLVSQPSSGFELQLRQKPLQVNVQSYDPGIPVQPLVPWAFVQVLPQAAQLVAVPSWVSHPAAMVQSAKPELQPVGWHEPVAHDAAPFGNEHAWPQFTQSVRVVTLVSQPSSGLPLQLRKPGSHVGEQSNAPGIPVQVFPPCAFVHALPQLAQFVAVPSCVSQPGSMPQSANPELHAPMLQVPVPHAAAAFG